MLTYLCETHFWTNDDDITVKHTDLGAFKYESKKESSPSVYTQGKRSLVSQRGKAWAPRGRRLRNALRELNGLLKTCRLLHASWCRGWLRLLFSTGALAHVQVNPATGDVVRILFDRYLCGKLLSNEISQVLFTDSHILLTSNDNQAILVYFNRPPGKGNVPDKMSNRDPKCQTVELVGGWRRGGRQVSRSCTGGSVLVWSRASPSDLFPWSPRTPQEDQANVHVYSLQGSQMTLKCFHRIEFDPLCVSFSKIHENVIYSVEQKTSRKGGVTVEWRRLEVGGGSELSESQEHAVRVAAPAPATCASRSPCETRLLLACSDRSVLLHHATHNVTTTVTAAFVARACCWSGSGGAVAVGGAGAQLQVWDSALTPARLSPPADHPPAEPLLHLTPYFKKEPSLSHLLWHEMGEEGGVGGFLCKDSLLLAIMQGGPLVCVRLFCTPQEDSVLVGVSGTGPRAATGLARLRGMDWTSQGAACLALLHRIVNTLFCKPLNAEREQAIQAALGTFLAPPQPLPPSVRLAHLPQLHDLCRRFFHHLVRYGRLEKALCLAIDVGHHDLFMDVHYAARASGLTQLATEAQQRAEDAVSSCESSCSRLSCSRCSGTSDSGSEEGSILEEDDVVKPVPQMDIYGPRLPPPLPFVPASFPPPPIKSVVPKPVVPKPVVPKPVVPKVPRFPEREHFPWGEDQQQRVLHRVVEIIPAGPNDVQPIFQAELSEISRQTERNLRVERPRINMNQMKPDGLIDLYTPVYHQHPTLAGRIPPPGNRDLQARDLSHLLTSRDPNHFPTQQIREPAHLLPPQMRDLSHLMTQIRDMSLLPPQMMDLNHMPLNPVPNITPLRNMSHLNILNARDLQTKNDYLGLGSHSESQLSLAASRDFLTSLHKRDLGLNGRSNDFLLPSPVRGGRIERPDWTPRTVVPPTPVIKATPQDTPTKPPGEKNKVKFSDTVTVAVVPEIPRKDRRIGRPSAPGPSNGSSGRPDPRRELADSLPLCHPHHDYLKDFTPQPETESKEPDKQSKIKVVHFGVV